ncbi:MAG: hypothetical protein EZS28_032894 [Streblomastix strix]|uniref:Uncharacterized protein n=1 Tax=Streblomastix strix TaxID=222440 RepID=A0A5J4UMD7_9EUKA|nr:MAG: hypothetical protein EZS28_032894 [Streblomastix strix]
MVCVNLMCANDEIRPYVLSGLSRKMIWHQYVLESWRIDSKQTTVLSDLSVLSHKVHAQIPAISSILPLDF